jgi:hypothetical protein
MTVQDHLVVGVEMLVEQPEHLRLRRGLGAVILEEGNRPRPRQGHGDGPEAELAALGDGAMRLAADRVPVVQEAEPVEQSHHPLVAVEAR